MVQTRKVAAKGKENFQFVVLYYITRKMYGGIPIRLDLAIAVFGNGRKRNSITKIADWRCAVRSFAAQKDVNVVSSMISFFAQCTGVCPQISRVFSKWLLQTESLKITPIEVFSACDLISAADQLALKYLGISAATVPSASTDEIADSLIRGRA
jgi:hypothetical protein